MAKNRGIKNFKDKVVVISGAGSGIGQAVAISLAKHGAKLALNDYSEDKLDRTIRLLPSDKSLVSKAFDVSHSSKWQEFRLQILEKYGYVDCVWNNAGVSLGKSTTWETPEEDLDWVMNVNFWGSVYGTKTFLDDLKNRPYGTSVIATSSVWGLAGAGYVSSYAASKFALRGYYESLAFELRNSNVMAHTIFPGGVKTNIARSAKGNDIEAAKKYEEVQLKAEAKDVVEQFIKQIENNKVRVFGGYRWRAREYAARIWPYYLMHYLQLWFGKDMIKDD